MAVGHGGQVCFGSLGIISTPFSSAVQCLNAWLPVGVTVLLVVGSAGVVTVVSIVFAVRAAILTRPRGYCNICRLKGVKVVLLCPWALLLYVSGCTWKSQPFSCSTTQYRSLKITILLIRFVCPFICWWYNVVVKWFVPKKMHSISKNLLPNCVQLVMNACVGT